MIYSRILVIFLLFAMQQLPAMEIQEQDTELDAIMAIQDGDIERLKAIDSLFKLQDSKARKKLFDWGIRHHWNKSTAVTEYLLQQGANVDTQDDYGVIPLLLMRLNIRTLLFISMVQVALL